MKIKFAIWSIIILSALLTSRSVSSEELGLYVSGGLTNLELEGEDSVNISIAAGYEFHKLKFESTSIQALSFGIEVQYSDSISGTDDVNSYSVFAVLRAHVSDKWYFKIKQGYTDFPDVTLRKRDAESSHIGAGMGLGLQINSGSIELEYVYPNKTIDASLLQINYNYHF